MKFSIYLHRRVFVMSKTTCLALSFQKVHGAQQSKQEITKVVSLVKLAGNLPSVSSLTLSVPSAFFLSFFFFLFLINYRLERSLYVKLKDRMSNSIDQDETAHYEPSHLDLYCLQKPIIISCGSERVNVTFGWKKIRLWDGHSFYGTRYWSLFCILYVSFNPYNIGVP